MRNIPDLDGVQVTHIGPATEDQEYVDIADLIEVLLDLAMKFPSAMIKQISIVEDDLNILMKTEHTDERSTSEGD